MSTGQKVVSMVEAPRMLVRFYDCHGTEVFWCWAPTYREARHRRDETMAMVRR